MQRQPNALPVDPEAVACLRAAHWSYARIGFVFRVTPQAVWNIERRRTAQLASAQTAA
jgi:hypothetical protein